MHKEDSKKQTKKLHTNRMQVGRWAVAAMAARLIQSSQHDMKLTYKAIITLSETVLYTICISKQ